jgi:carbon starvation protein CstA
MDMYDVVLVGDIMVLIGAILLLAAGKLLGEPWSKRFNVPATILIIAALMVYIVTEFTIGRGGNLAWGLLLVFVFAVIMYFVNKRNEGMS